MAPTVTLKISNPHNTNYPTIILRKFFNMVFVDHKGKKLHIYTATIFGGTDGIYDTKERESLPKPANINRSLKKHDCSLIFEYDIQDTGKSGNSSETISIDCKEITNITKYFLSESKPPNFNEINNVWRAIEPLKEEMDLLDALSELYVDEYKDYIEKKEKGEEIKVPTDLPNLSASPAYRIHDKKNRTSHHCIAYPGDYHEMGQNKYKLTAPSGVGVEAINWIKTTIELSADILKPNNIAERKIDFVIKFEGNGKFYAPDFTWYFAPPPNYIVDDSAAVDIGKNEDIPNIVASVSDSTTVKFKEWLDEGILERKKFRVLLSNYMSADPYVLTGSQVKVNLSFSNPKKHGNLQFLVGLLVSHFLGVCSDMGRLDRYRAACDDAGLCGPACKIFAQFQGCICENICNLLSILFPAAFILAFFAFCFRQNDCMPVKDRTRIGRMAIIGRWIGLCATVFLALYINLGWLVIPGVMQGLVKTCVANQVIVFVALLFSLVGNGFYTIYCWHFKKKHLIDFL